MKGNESNEVYKKLAGQFEPEFLCDVKPNVASLEDDAAE
jgi:hypothetical protein